MAIISGNNIIWGIIGKIEPTDDIMKIDSGKEELLSVWMKLTLSKEENSVVIQREIVRVTSINDNIIWIDRAVEACPLNDNATENTQIALEFETWDIFSWNLTSWDLESLNQSISNIEANKLDRNTAETINEEWEFTNGVVANEIFVNNLNQNWRYQKVIYVSNTSKWLADGSSYENAVDLDTALNMKHAYRTYLWLENTGVDYEINTKYYITTPQLHIEWWGKIIFNTYLDGSYNKSYWFYVSWTMIRFYNTTLENAPKADTNLPWGVGNGNGLCITHPGEAWYWINSIQFHSVVINQTRDYFLWGKHGHIDITYNSCSINLSGDADRHIYVQLWTYRLQYWNCSITAGYKIWLGNVWQDLITNITDTNLVDYAFPNSPSLRVPWFENTEFSATLNNNGNPSSWTHTVSEKWVYYVRINNQSWSNDQTVSFKKNWVVVYSWVDPYSGSNYLSWSDWVQTNNWYAVPVWLDKWDTIEFEATGSDLEITDCSVEYSEVTY